jgi:hypothetical protein
MEKFYSTTDYVLAVRSIAANGLQLAEVPGERGRKLTI